MSTRRRRQLSPETPSPWGSILTAIPSTTRLIGADGSVFPSGTSLPAGTLLPAFQAARSGSTIHVPSIPNFVQIGEYVQSIKRAAPAATMTYNHQCFVIQGRWSQKLLQSVLKCSLFEITGVSSAECAPFSEYRVNLATFNDFDYEHFDDWLTEHTAFTGRIEYSLNGLIIVDIYSDIDTEVFCSKCPGVLYFCGALKK